VRKILGQIIITVFLLIVAYVGWIIFDGVNKRSRREINENNAIRVLKQIHEAELNAQKKFGKFLNLDELIKENSITFEIKNSKFSGYNFSVVVEKDKYAAFASRNAGEGNISFFLDETGIIRSTDKLIAGPNDPPSKLQSLIK